MRIESVKGVLLATLFIASIAALAIPIHSSVTIENVGQWENLTNAPEGVALHNGHRIEAMGNYIYFRVADTNGFYRYNTVTNSWETLPYAPTTAEYGIGIVAAEDTAGHTAIYIISGDTFGIKGWHRYTEYDNSWVALSTSIPWSGSGASQPKPSNGSEFVWDNADTIYYFPGSGYSYNRYDWYKYTISTNTWTYMGEFNTTGDPKNGPGNSACFVTYGGENYIFIQFGHTPSGNYTSALFMRYKISTGQWTQMAQTGYGADDGADLVWDGGDYLYFWPGAYIEASSGGCDEYRFLRYSIAGNTWENLTEQPYNGNENGNDDAGAAGLVGSYIYRLKGGDGDGSISASNFYRYQMAEAKPTAWATGPTGSTNNPNVNITYNYTLTPTSVKLYYTKDGGTNWTLAGEDNSVDGTFPYLLTSGDGTYGWNAVAIGGGSTETDPPAGGTLPEAASLILNRAPTLIAPSNGFSENDNTPTFEWSAMSNPGGVTYQIQIDDNVDFISPVYFAVDLVENNHTLPGENALVPGTYFWRVRAVDNLGNGLNWSSIWTLFIIAGGRWMQTNWAGGPTDPSLQVGTWGDVYDNFYDNDNVNWLAGVRLDNYLGPYVTDHLVISEFATRGPNSTGAYDEFIELYNPTSSAVDISGWNLNYFCGAANGGWGGQSPIIATFPSGASVPSHGFYLWANSTGYSSPTSGPTPDYSTAYFGMADGSVADPRGIRLRDGSNTVIDTVLYGGAGGVPNENAEGGYTAPGGPTSGNTTISIERKAQSTSTTSSMGPGGADEYSGNAYDSNNNYNDWVSRNSRNPQNSSSTLEDPITTIVSQFRSAGWFESSIYDTGGVADWKIISWIENKPSGTSIIVEARTGVDNNPYDGGWSGWYQHNNGAENSLMDNGRYVQYRVELSTTDSLKTPGLSQITLTYELVPGIIRGVDVSISPSSKVGDNGDTLIYTVTVTNTGNVSDTYTLDNTDDLGWTKNLSNASLVMDAFSSDNTTTLSVTIPTGAAGGTVDNITVTANGTGVSDSAICTAHVTEQPFCGVDVTIENSMLEGYSSQVLEYTIDVHNSGNVVDNFSLSYIPDGWPDITIAPLLLIDVMPSEHRQATMFVHVPENVLPCTYKEVTIVVESQFCGATDNYATQAHVREPPTVTYTYPSSYSEVKGTVTDFANQQSADDGGAYSTLAERSVAGGGDPLNYTEGFEWGGGTPPGWSFQDAWAIKTNRVRTGAYSAGVTGAAGSTNHMTTNVFDLTGKSSVHLTYYAYASNAAASSTLTVDASIDGGSTWTVPVQAATTPGNGSWKQITETYDLSGLNGQSNVKFRWTMVKQGATTSYCVIDDITITAAGGGAAGNDMEIYENITGVPSADTQILEMRYELANTYDNFNVQVWNGSTWNTRGDTLDSTSWTDWSYTLLGSEVIGDTVQVRFVDVNPSSTPQDNILKDYLRVKSVAEAPFCGVDVTIDALLEGLPSQVLEYTIDVHNSGNVVDNFSLSYIPDGWPDITIAPLLLIDVMPSEHRQATMFVHVPDNALECTYKEITVVAESQFCGATDNATTEAHVTFTPIINYTYPSSYSTVKGTVTDFANQQSAEDNAYSTLAESPPAAEGWESLTAWPGAVASTVSCYAENSQNGAKYIMALESKSGPILYRYDIASGQWANVYSWPVTTIQGSSMVWTGGDNIYVINGSTAGFHRYKFSTGTAVAMADPTTTGVDGIRANTGSGLAWDGGDYIYGLFNYSSALLSWICRYQISTDTWTFLDNTRDGSANIINYGSGSCICKVGDYLYLGRGGGFLDYIRYNILTNTWTGLSPVPGTPGTGYWGSGCGQQKVSANEIYADLGGSGNPTNNFFRYSISSDNWTHLADYPAVVSNQGPRLAFDQVEYLYLIRGYSDSSFWRYHISTGAGYTMEIYENITGIPSADTQTLELRYELANTNDNFNVQVWDGSTWNTRGDTLDSASWTDWSYTLLSNEVIGGTVQVRFVDVDSSSTPQDNILKDYLRVKGEPATSCGVEVTIEPTLLEGYPSQVLAYTIDVHNSGNAVDDISLSYIPDGWPDINIVPSVLTDVLPGENSQATMFVHVPDNASPGTYKEITVVAESQFCGATDNDTTQAHVIGTPPPFSGSGSGTQANPYVITNLSQLQEMSNNLAAYYILGNDIDASATSGWNSGAGFEPVGTIYYPFTGGFDGRGYKIDNLWINRGGENYIGLYGHVGIGGVVENAWLENENVVGGDDSVGGLVGMNYGTVSNSYSTGSVSGNYVVGGLVGRNYYGTVSNCYSTCTCTENNLLGSVGGLVGCNYYGGTLSNCYSTGTVSGCWVAGGLVGYDWTGIVSNCYATGPVSGYIEVAGLIGDINHGAVNNSYATGPVSGSWYVGGLAGSSDGTVHNCYSTGTVIGYVQDVGGLLGANFGTVSNCYATGSVSGTADVVGGLVGWNSENTMSNCYSTGTVSGNSVVGGLVGRNDRPVSNCFWNIETSGQSTSAGGTGKTTENMKNVRTFTDNTWSEGLNTPWDFVGNPYGDLENANIWNISPDINSGYPSFAWQVPQQSFVRGPILIVGNDNFIPEKGVNGGGSGTELDPYIIENWIISAENAHGIDIRNTTAYFVVRNCVIENGDIGWPALSYYGIRLENVANGRIENNLSENNNYGIVLYANSRNNVVTNNDLENYAWYGVRLEYSHNNLISNNFFDITKENTTSATWAIGLHEADSNDLENNIIENLGGIYLYDAENIKMRNNIHSSTSSGLAIEGDNGNLLHFIHDIDNSNLVNGKPVLYLIGHSNEVIGPSQEIGYLGLVNCDNILVENLVFARRENNRNLSGILMANTQNSRVENCAFENNNYGIYITCGSNNNILTHNSVDNNATGIDILFSSDNNIIEYNTITQNRVYGVLFYQYFVGPEIKPAGLNNTIRNNNVTLNNRGIYIPDSNENNRIYHNNFEISTLYQAYDNGSNYWDDGYPSGGNHWSDYAGVDDYSGENQDIPGSDGIGDTPYYITGDNNQDRYPLMTLAPCTGTASIRLATGTAPFLWGIRKVKTTENLVVNTGDNLRLIFLAYNNVTVESEDVIWSRTAIGTQIVNLTDLIVSHDNSLTWPAGDSPSIALAMPAGNVKRVKLILTDSAGNVIVDNMAWYTVVQDDWSNRISWIILNWASHSSPQQDQLSNEISTIILSWAGVPTVRDQHDFSQL